MFNSMTLLFNHEASTTNITRSKIEENLDRQAIFCHQEQCHTYSASSKQVAIMHQKTFQSQAILSARFGMSADGVVCSGKIRQLCYVVAAFNALCSLTCTHVVLRKVKGNLAGTYTSFCFENASGRSAEVLEMGATVTDAILMQKALQLALVAPPGAPATKLFRASRG